MTQLGLQDLPQRFQNFLRCHGITSSITGYNDSLVSSPDAPQLRRELGFGDGLALMLGMTIGAGIFATPGRIAGYFPSVWIILLAWTAAGLFAFAGSLLYAELGTRFPDTGGEYVYLHRAFGPLPAFLYGWSQLLVIRTNPGAALSLVFAEYAASLFPMPENARIALAAATLVTLGTANYFGLRSGKRVQAITTILKVGGILAFIIGGALLLRDASYLATTHVPSQKFGPLGNTSSAMLLIIFAYLGWDRVGYLAGEMRNPERNLPRVLAVGSISAALLYLSMNVVYHAALPISSISGSRVPAADVARLLWGPAGLTVLALVVMVSTAGSTNGTIMASSRVYYAMARDGLFFDSLARVHPRWRSPHVAVVLHCGWAIVLLLASRTVETLVGSFVFSVLIFYGAVTLAYFKFRRQGPASFQAPGYPVVPALYLLVILAMVITTCYFSTRSALVNLALMGTGLPFYFFWRRRK